MSDRLPAPEEPLRDPGAHDACPDTMTLHRAADGLLARVRVPCGVLAAHQCREFAALLRRELVSAVDITGRANIQLRGIHPDCVIAVQDALTACGLTGSGGAPATPYIFADPFYGLSRDGEESAGPRGRRALLHDRDQVCAITAEYPELRKLPGKFAIGMFDRADSPHLPAMDIAIIGAPTPSGRAYRVALPALHTTFGPHNTLQQATRTAIELALRFMEVREHCGDGAWRLRELSARAVSELALRTPGGVPAPAARPPQPPPKITEFTEADGFTARHLHVFLGRVPAVAWELLGDVINAANNDGHLRLTPWRTLVLTGSIPDDPMLDHRLTAAGLHPFPTARGANVWACAGAGECRRARSNVRGFAGFLAGENVAGDVHVFGCERRCGLPEHPVHQVVASEGTRGRTYDVSTRAGAHYHDVAPARVIALISADDTSSVPPQ